MPFIFNFDVSTINNLKGNIVHMGRAWFIALEDSYWEGMLYLNSINAFFFFFNLMVGIRIEVD